MNPPRPFVLFLIVVVVVLVGLYVLGAGSGLRSRPTPSFRDLEDSFGRARLLGLDELPDSAACRHVTPGQLSVRNGVDCAFQLPAVRAWQRRALALRRSSGQTIHVTVGPARGQGITVEGDPEAGKWSEFSIPGDGAMVTIRCLAPATTCAITVCGNRPCP
jgi:hypothetical protein